MRVWHVISGIAPELGGPTAALQGLVGAQVRAGLHVGVLATAGSQSGLDNAESFRRLGADCVVYGLTRGKFGRFPELRRRVDEHLSDAAVVHVHAMWEDVQHHAARVCSARGIPYVWRPANAISSPSMRKSGWKKRLMLLMRSGRDVRGASMMHYATEQERTETAWLGLPGRAVVEPNGVDMGLLSRDDLPEVGRMLPEVGGRRVVLFVGRLSREKNLPGLVAGFLGAVGTMNRTRSGSGDEWVLVLVGGEDERPYRGELEGFIERCAARGRVILAGARVGEEKAGFYRGADLFALVSPTENFGIAVAESMAAGRAVLVSRGVGLAADVVRSGSGVVCDGDVESIASGLAELMGDEASRRAMGARAIAYARERFDWDAIAGRWVEHYRSLVG
jgi:glycosyltransferase involved in cell wall biosynthesis